MRNFFIVILLSTIPFLAFNVERSDEDQLPLVGTTTIRDVEIRPLRRADWDLSEIKDSASSLPLQVNNWYLPLKINSILVLPGDTLRVSLTGPEAISDVSLRSSAGTGFVTGNGSWNWIAPLNEGFYAFDVSGSIGSESTHVNVFVGVPKEEIRDGMLRNYPMGAYRKRPASRGPSYTRPRGFIGVTRADEDILLSPHFTLGELLCKEPGNPRFAIVSPNIINKIEALLVQVRLAGIKARTLTVMSGYRTPAYNRKIGNTTTLSRHLYGDATDVYVDLDGNSWMDDLDGDGKITISDAQFLARLMDKAMEAKRFSVLAGGMKTYRPNAVRGPFLHIDTRGRRARW